MITEATHEDIPAIVRMARAFFDTTPYGFLGFDPMSVENVARFLIGGGGVVFIYRNPDPVGMIALACSPFFCNSSRLMVEECMWWVDPEHRRSTAGLGLLKKAEKWSAERGASGLVMASINESANSIYDKMGYLRSDQRFMKPLGVQ